MCVWSRAVTPLRFVAFFFAAYLAMADIILVEEEEKRESYVLGTLRRFRDRTNPLEDMLPNDVYKRYRFQPETIMFLVSEVYENLAPTTRRSNPLPVTLLVLVTLRFFATNSMQRAVGDIYDICPASVSRAVAKVCRLFAGMHSRFVCFPNQKGLFNVKRAFTQLCHLPNVIGVIDGSLIRIPKPTLNTQDYMSRKGFAAINIQVSSTVYFTCDNCNKFSKLSQI